MTEKREGNPRQERKEAIDFELEKIEKEGHELLESYRPRMLGYGASQFVFDIEGHPNIVAKVDIRTLHRVLELNLDEGVNVEDLPDDARRAMELLREEDRKTTRELKAFFKSHVLPERSYIHRVPVTKEMLKQAFVRQKLLDSFPEGTQNLWTIVRIQERAPQESLESGGGHTVGFRYVELAGAFNDEEYKQLNSALIDGKELIAREDFEKMLKPSAQKLLENMGDPKYIETMHDFLYRSIRYTEATGQILDLAGPENVVMYPKGKGWDYLLIDAKHPEKTAAKAVIALDRVREGSVQRSDANYLLNALNYVRTINGMAAMTGFPQRLQIFDTELADMSTELYDEIYTAHTRKNT